MAQAGEFLFIVAVPVVLALAALVSLFAVGALFDALDNPGEISSRVEAISRRVRGWIEGIFHRPPKPPSPPPPDHYYKAYWEKP